MPKNSFLKAIFSGPKFSLAPIEENNRGTVKIGQVIPVWSTVLNPREGVELNMAHLVRFMPAKAPVMEGYKVTFDAFAVPFSCLGYADRMERHIDDFFNIKENSGNMENPFCFPMSRLGSMLAYDKDNNGIEPEDCSLANGFRPGSLADYINFPSLKNVRTHVRKWLSVNPFLYGSGIGKFVTFGDSVNESNRDAFTFCTLALLNYKLYEGYSYSTEIGGSGSEYSADATFGVVFSTADNPVVETAIDSESENYHYYNDSDSDSILAFKGAYSLLGYILQNYPAVAAYYRFDEINFTNRNAFGSWVILVRTLISDSNPISLDYLQVLYDNYGIDAQSIYNEYFEYIMSLVLYNADLHNYDNDTLYEFVADADNFGQKFLPVVPDDSPIDLSYLSAYWKIIADWYINTNIDGDPDDFFLGHSCLLVDHELSTRPALYVDTKPFVRRWANDIFTSSVPMAQVNNVRIPADGTIPDLREANAYQKLVDIFRNTGSRLRDVIYGVFGITPSAVRSEMSEPIGSFSTWIGMQSVLQTSQTTEKSPQAAYAGIGTDSGGFKRILKYVNNAEPTPVIIMVLMSVTQRASYMQGFDRKFFRKSIYDFAIPELAMIGEQEVTNKEVYFDKDYNDGVFGFNRRYYDWFQSHSQVHGELRDTLDYWHGARIFDSQPSLNREFIGINSDVDHLQRVFANISEDSQPIVYNLSFDGYKTVALPRYIQYEL